MLKSKNTRHQSGSWSILQGDRPVYEASLFCNAFSVLSPLHMFHIILDSLHTTVSISRSSAMRYRPPSHTSYYLYASPRSCVQFTPCHPLPCFVSEIRLLSQLGRMKTIQLDPDLWKITPSLGQFQVYGFDNCAQLTSVAVVWMVMSRHHTSWNILTPNIQYYIVSRVSSSVTWW